MKSGGPGVIMCRFYPDNVLGKIKGSTCFHKEIRAGKDRAVFVDVRW